MKNLFLFCCVVISISGFAQNLVPDPGFEITSEDCEPYPGLVHWFSPSLGTPDLYSYSESDCGFVLDQDQSQQFQYPQTAEGDRFIGMYCCEYEGATIQTREYFSTELTESLIANQVYTVSLSVHRAKMFNFAIDKIGLLFTIEPPYYETIEVIPQTPQLETNTLLDNSISEWIELEWEYTAQGGESFITLGCFRGYEELEVINTNSSWKDFLNAYYLVDKVSILPSTNSQIEYAYDLELVQIYANQAVISIPEMARVELFSIGGNVVSSWEKPATPLTTDLSNLIPGVYVLRIISVIGKTYSKKIIIT
jgi:hypothetical protein